MPTGLIPVGLCLFLAYLIVKEPIGFLRLWLELTARVGLAVLDDDFHTILLDV